MRDASEDLMLIAQIFHNQIVASLASGLLRPPKKELFGLTARERQCLTMTARGNTAKEIAALLEIEAATVKEYLKTARSKLQTKTTAHAISKAITLGIFSGINYEADDLNIPTLPPL